MDNNKIKTIIAVLEVFNNHITKRGLKTKFDIVSPYTARIFADMLTIEHVYFDTDGVTFLFNDGDKVFKTWDNF